MVALQLDHALLGRAADAAALLQPPGQGAGRRVVAGGLRQGGARLPAPARPLAAPLHAAARRRRARLLGAPLAPIAAVARVDEVAHFTPSRSTTNTSVSSGLITGGAPR